MPISRSSTYFLRRLGLIPFDRPGAQLSIASLMLQQLPDDVPRFTDEVQRLPEGNPNGERPGTLPWSDPPLVQPPP